VPDAPSAGPTRNAAGTTSTTIQIDFPTISSSPENGGSPVTSLNLQWDQGSASWTSLLGESSDSLVTSFTVTGLTPGGSYQFRYRAKNIYGWGPTSTAETIIAATSPSQMDPVTTSISGSNVKISWSAPDSNGSPITAYTVSIADQAYSTWTPDLTNCDASSDPVKS